MIETGRCKLCNKSSKIAIGPVTSPLILCPQCDARVIAQISKDDK